jgi:predicted NUDIX family phosphoesterase
MSQDTTILALPRVSIPGIWLPHEDALRPDPAQWRAFLQNAPLRWASRRQLETDETHKQPIPYLLIQNHDHQLATHIRAGGETRLHGLHSIGIGGHVEKTDIPPALRDNALLGDILPRALHRELLEETTFAATRPLATRFLGIINEECTPVGRVHWGLVYLLQLAPSDTLHPRHELCDFAWRSPAVLATRPCEHWTTLALKLLPTPPAP